jgi:outer membrane lipoprotein-sorting protein
VTLNLTGRAASAAVAILLASGLPALAQTTPAPPSRPAGITAPAAAVVAKPATPEQNAPRSGAQAMTEAEALARVNAYLNSFRNLSGSFIQFGADGKRHEGQIYLSRPGKLRFEYKPPATIDVVADGTSVAVRDRKLATQDLYTIAQTPLKFLVRDRIDLGSDLKVVRVQSTPELVRVALEDKSTLGGTSKITLTYDPVANALRQWIVVDPQGYETTIAVYNLDTQKRPDPSLFVINYQRQIETNSSSK